MTYIEIELKYMKQTEKNNFFQNDLKGREMLRKEAKMKCDQQKQKENI